MYIVAFAHQLYTKYHIDGALQTEMTADSMGEVNIECRNERHHLGLTGFKTEMSNSNILKIYCPIL